jgi:hypothetical protein
LDGKESEQANEGHDGHDRHGKEGGWKADCTKKNEKWEG